MITSIVPLNFISGDTWMQAIVVESLSANGTRSPASGLAITAMLSTYPVFRLVVRNPKTKVPVFILTNSDEDGGVTFDQTLTSFLIVGPSTKTAKAKPGTPLEYILRLQNPQSPHPDLVWTFAKGTVTVT